jgi:ferredoxin
MESTSKLRIIVDHNRCCGSTLCVQLSPKVFALNDEGQSIVLDPDADSMKAIFNAADNCPQSAIRVWDAETGQPLFPPEEEA